MDKENSFSPRFLLLSLLGIAFFLVFIQANAPSLDSDGIHYAAVAKEMARSGRWLFPFDPVVAGPHYWHFSMCLWPTALFFKWFGVGAATAKLYSMLMTVAAVGGLFVLGKTLSRSWVGWFSGITFLLTNHVLRIARQCRPDLPLIGFIVWAFVGLVLAQTRSRWWYLLTGVACWGAVMTKEFVGLVPLVAGAGYLILRGNWRELVHPAFLAAWGIAILPVLGWIGLEQALYQDSLWNHYYAINFSHLLQLKDPTVRWYYYGWAILDKYWYLLPFALAGGWLAFQKIRNQEEPRWLLIFLWAIAFPVGFSLAQHKIHYYILPTYAATALWVGLCCDRWIPEAWKQRVVRSMIALVAVAAVALACFPVDVHKNRYPVSLVVAPQMDVFVRENPGEVIVVRQDVASLLVYSEAIHRITSAHNWPQFQEILSRPSDERRYCFIAHKDWQLLDANVRASWETLFDDGERLFLKQEGSST